MNDSTYKTSTGVAKNEWFCWVCGRPLVRNSGAISSHLRRHVREGIIDHVDKRFATKPRNFWGWISSISQEFIMVRTNLTTRALRRFQVGGIIRVGDAVRLEFKATKDNKKRGIWYAHPLGYKADWRLQ